MNSLYGQYIAAREGFGIVETDRGFVTYKIQGEEIYLRDLYLTESARHCGHARELADEVCAIGKKAGCKYLSGSVSPQDPEGTENLKALLSYGMRLHSSVPGLIYFVKEL